MSSVKNPVSPKAPLKTILLVDDMDASRITTKWFLTYFNYAVVSARSAEEALVLFDPKAHDLVLTDNSMPGMSGAQMSGLIKERCPSTPILMYTGRPPADQSCLDLVIQKPTHLLVIKEAVDKLLAALSLNSMSQK